MALHRLVIRSGMVAAALLVATQVQFGGTASAQTAPMGSGDAQSTAAPEKDNNSQAQSSVHDEVGELRAQMQKMAEHDQELEEKVAKLEAAQSTTQPSAEDVKAAIDSVLQDANEHSQFLTSMPANLGWDPEKGLQVRSEDGNFLFHPFVLLQVRDVTDRRDNAKAGGSDDTQNGFEIRRMQLGADGNVYSPDLTYRIFIQTNRAGGAATLFDAWVKYHLPDISWSIEGGQFKAPLAHEQMIFDRTMMAADRSLSDDILANGEAFSEGVMAIYDNHDAFRGKVDFTNGYNVNDVNFQDFPTNPANFGLGGRVEYKLMGDWKDYDQFTSLGDKQDLLVVGGGADWTEAGPTDTIRQAVDIQWNHGGLGLYGGYIGRYTSHNAAAGDTFDSSFTGQVSYLFTNMNLEPFGRYDYLKFDSNEFPSGTKTGVHEITIGLNYYFYGQNCKFTLDGSYLPYGSPVDDNGSGVLVDTNHGEFIARAQFQLAI